jgi:hypothetical protein
MTVAIERKAERWAEWEAHRRWGHGLANLNFTICSEDMLN